MPASPDHGAACEGTTRAFWMEAVGYLGEEEGEEQHFYLFSPFSCRFFSFLFDLVFYNYHSMHSPLNR